jgi:hypothetical protein
VASSLLIYTIFWPLGLGAILALVLMKGNQREPVLAFIVIASLITIYILLEGLPGLPPIGAKQKLVFVFMACVLAIAVASRQYWRRGPVSAVVLSTSLLWLGWSKFVIIVDWNGSIFLLAPLICAVLASRSLSSRSEEPFLWPLSLLNFAIGNSLLSLLGAFIGFAQVMGAFAAWTGGFLAMRYAFTLAKFDKPSLPISVLWLALLSFVSGAFMIGLFAPNLNRAAFAILSLTLVTPIIVPEFVGLSPRIKPIAFAVMTSVPALVAVLIALSQRGMSASS